MQLFNLVGRFFRPSLGAMETLRGYALPEAQRCSALLSVVDWERQRSASLAKGLATTAVAVVIAALGAHLDEHPVGAGEIVAVIVTSVGLLVWAAALSAQLPGLSSRYTKELVT